MDGDRLDSLLVRFPVAGHGVVFAAGGASDIVLARCLAARCVALGASRVDIVQPLGTDSLERKGISGIRLGEFALQPFPGVAADLVLRHHASLPNSEVSMRDRGKGIRISTALHWDHGDRLVCAGKGLGLQVVAARPWRPDHPYDFALGVDGGGDVLTHDETEFDRVVVGAFASAWSGAPGALGLIAMGLGADGGSTPEEFVGACPPGWTEVGIAELDGEFADGMEQGLREARCWLDDPTTWSVHDPAWDYGLNVPQIVAMAIRGHHPFPCPGPGLATFPRRKKLTVMSPELLRQARMFVRSLE